MAELIALLLAAVASLMSAGASPAEVEAQVRETVLKHPPVPLADVHITATPAEELTLKDGEQAPPPGSVQLTFDFTDLYLEPLLIKHAVITVGGVQPGAEGKLSIGSIDFQTTITEQALTDALQADTTELGPDPQVTIDEEGVALQGSYSALLTRIPFEVKGNLSVQNQTQLIFSIDRSKMAGMKVPGPVNKLIEREVNPVYDLAKFHERSKKDIDRAKEQLNYDFHLLLDRLTPQAGYIIVTGTA